MMVTEIGLRVIFGFGAFLYLSHLLTALAATGWFWWSYLGRVKPNDPTMFKMRVLAAAQRFGHFRKVNTGLAVFSLGLLVIGSWLPYPVEAQFILGATTILGTLVLHRVMVNIQTTARETALPSELTLTLE